MKENYQEKIKLDDLATSAKAYLNNRIFSLRLYAIDRVSGLVADLITNTIVIICFTLAFIIGMVCLAIYIAETLNNYAAGFGIVTLLFLLIAIVISVTKKKYVEPAVANVLIRKFLRKFSKEEADEQV